MVEGLYKMRRLLQILGICLLLPALCYSTTYYISTTGSDGAAGTSPSTAFATFGKANSVVVAGDTVRVLAGTYDLGTGNVRITTSGTSGSPITWISDTPRGAIIKSTNDCIWDNAANWQVIQGFVIDGKNTSPSRLGICEDQQGSSSSGNDIIRGNEIRNIFGGCLSSGAGSAALAYFSLSGNNDIVEKNLVHDNGGANGVHTSTCGTDQGIYIGGTAQNVTVRNNIAYLNAGWGIQVSSGTANGFIVNNTVFNNTRGGIVLDGANGWYVGNNIVYSNGGTGCGIDPRGTIAITYGPNVVQNNQSADFCNTESPISNPSGTIVANPQFANYQSNGSGDYHLHTGSPAIDAGTTTNAPSDDYDGISRPQGCCIDIGAYEFVISGPVITPGQTFTHGNLVSAVRTDQATSCSVTLPSVPANALILYVVASDQQPNSSAQTFAVPTASGLTFAAVTGVTQINAAGAVRVYRSFTGSVLGPTAITSSGWPEPDDAVCAAIWFTGTSGTTGNNGSDAIGNICTNPQGSSQGAISCSVLSSNHDKSWYFGVFDAPNSQALSMSAGTGGPGYTALGGPVFSGTFVNAFWELSNKFVTPPQSVGVMDSVSPFSAQIVQGIELLASSTTSTGANVTMPRAYVVY